MPEPAATMNAALNGIALFSLGVLLAEPIRSAARRGRSRLRDSIRRRAPKPAEEEEPEHVRLGKSILFRTKTKDARGLSDWLRDHLVRDAGGGGVSLLELSRGKRLRVLIIPATAAAAVLAENLVAGRSWSLEREGFLNVLNAAGNVFRVRLSAPAAVEPEEPETAIVDDQAVS